MSMGSWALLSLEYILQLKAVEMVPKPVLIPLMGLIFVALKTPELSNQHQIPGTGARNVCGEKDVLRNWFLR